ncbi:MAG: rhomboid family intramembrane serine protease [Polyangia bacterium]
MAFPNSSYQMPPWLRPMAQRLSPTIRTLVVGLAVPWLFYVLVEPARGLMDEYLVLGPGVMKGRVWQIVTALFVDRSPLGFLNLLGLWFVGAAIERTLGRRRFLVVFFAPGLAANVAVALVSAWLGRWTLYSGFGDSVLGLFVGMAVLYGPAQVRVIGNLVMPARALAALFVALALVGSAMYGGLPAMVGTIVAVCLAYFLCGGRGRDLGNLVSWLQHKIGRRRWRVMEGGKRGRGPDRFN